MPGFSTYYCNPWPSQVLNLTGDLAATSLKTVRGGVANLTVAGSTSANSVSVSALSNAGTTISTTLTPSGGSFSGPLQLPVGFHKLTITAGTNTITRQVYVPYHFYGVNGHPDYDTTTFSAPNWLTMLSAIGAKTIRMNSYNSDATMNARVRALMDYFWTNNTGVSILPCISVNPYLTDATSSNNTESANYTLGFNTGATVASRLQAPFYECGNELFTRGAAPPGNPGSNPVQIDNTVQGDKRSHYATPGWKCVRGLQRGLIDGVKSVQPNALCGVNFVAAQFAAADMLWTGWNPDDTTDLDKAVHWDFTTWDNYQAQGSMFGLTTNGHGSNFDVYNYIRNSHTVVETGASNGQVIFYSADGVNPLEVHVTEWNAKPGDLDTSTAVAWVNQELPKHRARMGAGDGTNKGSGLMTSCYYQADNDGTTSSFGLLNPSGNFPNKKAAYLAVSNANPDT